MTRASSMSRASRSPLLQFGLRVLGGFLGAAMVAGLTSCGGGSGARPVVGRTDYGAASLPLHDGSCRADAVVNGDSPVWARQPGAPSPPPRHAVAHGDGVVAYFFAYPLRAKLPANEANKVLWYIADPTTSEQLQIVASRPGTSVTSRRVGVEAGDAAGHIQRSRMLFPSGGCWRLTLTWGTRSANVDVNVKQRP
jgi:hypothetical protein